MADFQVLSPLTPQGDQPRAIEQLVAGFREGKEKQVLLGVTGSGKTFTMAKVVEALNRPTLVLSHNKTLAAQLYQEFRSFFPKNRVEYFVSYYDYYQPEAYVPQSDTYIEKETQINDEIDKLRIAATAALFERRDVLIVASVSCIYGLGSPESFGKMAIEIDEGRAVRDDLVPQAPRRGAVRDGRTSTSTRGTFRVRGDVLDIVPSYEDLGPAGRVLRRRDRADHALRDRDRAGTWARSRASSSSRSRTTSRPRRSASARSARSRPSSSCGSRSSRRRTSSSRRSASSSGRASTSR